MPADPRAHAATSHPPRRCPWELALPGSHVGDVALGVSSKMASQSYKVVSLWRNDCSYPVKGLEALSGKTLSGKPQTTHLTSALRGAESEWQESPVAASLPRHCRRATRPRRHHCLERSCVMFTLLTPFPRQKGLIPLKCSVDKEETCPPTGLIPRRRSRTTAVAGT